MVDLDTFVTWLYVTVDDYCKDHVPLPRHPGRSASLCPSEVITLALLGQWARFGSERRFYREVQRRLGAAFPRLPDRSQFNRLVRQYGPVTCQLAVALGGQVAGRPGYAVLDTLGIRTRDAHRRGRGWLPDEVVDLGRCTRLGWYVGIRFLTVATPQGAITGYACAPASTNDRVLADELLAARRVPPLVHLRSAGPASPQPYLADGGFWSPRWQTAWRTAYAARVLAPPQRGTRFYARWPKWARRLLASRRQIVETVHDRLLEFFALERGRPHSVAGLLARLAANVGVHNFCCWLNQQLGRPLLAVADLIDW